MMWVLSLFAVGVVQRVLGSDYILVDQAKKWAEANKYCADTYKTRLAVITNDAQNADANEVRKGKTVWIGLTDFKQEQIWAWVGGTPATYRNWDAGQPDNFKLCEDCAEMWRDKGKWNDADCTNARPFICDSPAPEYSKHYIYLATPKTFAKANEWCKLKFKTTLAGIPNAERNKEAHELRKGNTWFGLTDSVKEGLWINEDRTLQMWKNWQKGQPDNNGGHQDCALLWPGGFWDDQACHTELPFLCNRENPSPPSPITTTNYYYVPYKKNWPDANAFCKSKYSTTLASIPSGSRNAEIYELAKKIGEDVWFGLNDRMAEKSWVYADGTEVEWTWWANGEPAEGGDAKNQGENCAEFIGYQGHWVDADCKTPKYFLCNRVNPPPLKPIYTTNYIYVGLKRTWDEANDYCKSRFATNLASIPNTERNTELLNLRKKPEVGQNFWFGLNDRNKEGLWGNVDGTLFMWSNWAPNEPNDHGDQDCGQFYSDGKWDDDKCALRKTFVCNRRKARPPFFVYVNENLKWHDANAYCKKHFGTTLAVVNSLEKNIEASFIRGKEKKNAWMGLSDFKSEDKWVWPDLKLSEYFNWAAGEPNNVALCEDCVEIAGNDGKWNDRKCETAQHFLCNAPPPPAEAVGSSNFIYVRNPMNWVNANAYCQTHFKTTLATIESAGQNDEARKFSSNKFWFGFNDRSHDHDGKWVWANGDVSKYTNWAPGEPNDAGRAEDCAEMYADGKWNDIPCYLQKEFVCNRPAHPGPCNCWMNDGKQISCDSTPFAHLDKETGLYWTWASPCSGKCGGLVNPIPYGWRRATDEEFKTRPKDIAFFGYQDSMGQPVQSKDHPGVCSANIFDKVFNHCDSIDFKNGFVTNKDNNRVDETLLVHDSGKDCPKWAEREFAYLADLEKEVDVDVDVDDAQTTVVVVGGQEYF